MRLHVDYQVTLTDDQANDLVAWAGGGLSQAGITGPHALQIILQAHGTAAIDKAKGAAQTRRTAAAETKRDEPNDEETETTRPDSAALDQARPTPVQRHGRKAGPGG
jgi:hypothetical protein